MMDCASANPRKVGAMVHHLSLPIVARRRLASPFLAAGVLVGFALAPAGFSAPDSSPGGSFAEWQRASAALRSAADLLRYHSFETVGDGTIPNEVGREGALAYRPAAGAPAGLAIVPGRWPGKKAIRLDGDSLEAPAFPVERSFTVCAWVRLNGQGAFRGNHESTNGTIFSSGTGYTDGWRLTVTQPERTLVLSMGRPVERSFSVTSRPAGASLWQHLAVSWDGQSLRIYVDGQLLGSGDYAGSFTPAKNFRIGFANHGVGSVRMDLDELAVYRNALPAGEVIRLAHFYLPLADADAALMGTAEQRFAAKEYAAAVSIWRELADRQQLGSDYRAVALLGLTRALTADLQSNEAALAAAQVSQLPGVAERHRRNADLSLLRLLPQIAATRIPVAGYERLLRLDGLSPAEQILIRRQLAQRCRDTGDPGSALTHYRKIFQDSNLTPSERLDLRLQMGHACLEARDWEGSKREYEAVLQETGIPAYFQTQALFCLADACQGQGDLAGARKQLGRLANVAGMAAHHEWEARERLKELDRLAAGMPVRDPAESRIPPLKWPAPGGELFVAPGGNDEHAGTASQPFATVNRARDAIRALKKAGPLPLGGVTVWLRGGVYPVSETFCLAQEDSGTAEAPIVYAAFQGEAVKLSAGTRLRGFHPVRNPAILERLPGEVRGKVMEIDLRAQGIKNLGSFEAGGYASGRGFRTHPNPWLFFDGQTMPLSRWPNQGFLEVGELLSKETAFEHRGTPGTREGVFTYTGERPARWRDESDLWLYGFWFHDWADSYEKVAAVDPAKRSLTLAAPYHRYGYRQGQRYCVVNALAEIDAPGEWYLDRAAGRLFFYPPADPDQAAVELAGGPSPLVRMEQASHIRFRGITWELGQGDGVIVRGGASCLLAGCTVRKLAGDGIRMTGTGHQVISCDLSELGRGGIELSGGDRKSLQAGGNVVENCHIHHISRFDHTYTPAVLIRGVGARIAHNLFSDGNSSAMRIEGNDCLVEYNEVHHVVQDSDDQGGVDMFGNPGYRGNVYRFNYWHDIGNGLRCGQAGIRLDDAISGTLIYGNIFFRCSGGGFGGVQIHGGKDNIVDNNLFLECRAAISFSPWGEQRWKEFLARPDVQKLLYEQVDISKPPYSTRYPELGGMNENNDVNRVWRNRVLNCGQFLARDRGIQQVMDNRVSGIESGVSGPGSRGLPFAAAEIPLRSVGMRAIPLEEMGLYPDSLRPAQPGQVKP